MVGADPRVKEMGPGKLHTQMSPTHGMQNLGAWQGMSHPALAGVTAGSYSGWPELFQLFLCYRGKQNLLQMQCPFISHAASLPVWSGPFDGTRCRERHHGGLSILAGTLGWGCPYPMVAPHPPCLADTCSWRFHHFGLEVVSLPAACTPATCCCGLVLSSV